ncbi:MAG: hypothetical protein BMS9Abin37_2215 [Acidobacteriota bacterium]|nr:MAG: hypothetical protein BMS9Abin37_2215 [Acidobacteriota bacterium]
MTIRDVRLAAHLRALDDEEIGVGHRMKHFYVPLFRDFCRQRGLEPKQVRILDCGCGNGTSVEHLREAGFFASGVDLAPTRYQQWRQRPRLPGVHRSQADATYLPFVDGSFDIVLSSGLIEHIGVAEQSEPEYHVRPLPNQQELRGRFLSECLRVLRRPGVFYLDYPNGLFPIDFWHNDYRSRPRVHRPGEKFLPSYWEASSLARAAEPACRIRALSPAGRFTFRRSQRRWYGKLFYLPMVGFFRLLTYPLVRRLAGTCLNPYLVLQISKV